MTEVTPNIKIKYFFEQNDRKITVPCNNPFNNTCQKLIINVHYKVLIKFS